MFSNLAESDKCKARMLFTLTTGLSCNGNPELKGQRLRKKMELMAKLRKRGHVWPGKQ